MSVVELVRVRVDPSCREAFLRARPLMLRDYAEDREGFNGAQLIQLSGDDWLDLVMWRSCDDFEASRAKGVNLPGIRAYAENITEILADEQGEMLDVEWLRGARPWVPEAAAHVAASSLSREERN